MAFWTIVWLVSHKYITPEVFGNCFAMCAIAFAGGNVGEHFANRKQS